MKRLAFTVASLGVLFIGLPLMCVLSVFVCMAMNFVLPALLIAAILRAVWRIPSTIRYRRLKGEFRFQTIGRRYALGLKQLSDEEMFIEARRTRGTNGRNE